MKHKPLIWLATLATFALLMWWEGAYNFQYIEQWQTFVDDRETVLRMLSVTGGAANVAALWLVQFFAVPLAGVAITAALLTATAAATAAVMRRVSGDDRCMPLAAVPAVATMVLHYNINYFYAGTVSMLAAMVCALVVLRINNVWLRLGLGLAVCALLFVATGPAAMLFAVLMLMAEAAKALPRSASHESMPNGHLEKKDKTCKTNKNKFGFSCFGLFFLVFPNGALRINSRRDSYSTSQRNSLAKSALFIALPFVVLILACYAVRNGYVGTLRHALTPVGYFTHRLPASPIVWLPWGTLGVVTLLGCVRAKVPMWLNATVALGCAVFFATSYIDPDTEFFKELSCHLGNEDWAKVAERYDERPSDNALFNSMASIAHIEQMKAEGRDTEGMFPLVVENKNTPHFKALMAEGCYTGGHNGTAMHYAFEANQSVGNGSPRMLKLLVRTNMAMGEWDVAMKYITILRHTRYHKAWADAQAARIPERSTAAISPDYADVTVPCNIAPLRFTVCDADVAKAVFTSGKATFTVETDDGFIGIGEQEWRSLLAASGRIDVEVSGVKDGGWKAITRFPIHVSPDSIDPYLAYRLIEPGYETWNEMSISQRCLETFEETALLTNRTTNFGCMNCHSFHQQSPDRMLFHLRVDYPGTYVRGVAGDKNDGGNGLRKLDLDKPLVYPSWHPDGRHVAFSRNTTQQIFHPTDTTRVEVFDIASDVVVANVETGAIASSPLLSSDTSFETFPTFSADGRTLYFCSADSVNDVEHNWQRVHYSLCSIAFNPTSQTFGDRIDTLVNAKQLNKSVSFPRVSPEGRFLMFTLHYCGNFSIWHRDADLYLIPLDNLDSLESLDSIEQYRLSVNSDDTESYHTWSSNGRWVVFSSRRDDGLYTRPYFAHIDKDGNATKPFVLPQRSKDFYIFQMKSYNVPEFVKRAIEPITSSHNPQRAD